MIIRYFAMLRDATRKSEERREIPPPSIRELLDELCASYGQSFRQWILDEHGNVGGLAIVLVNGVDYRHLNGLETALKDDDVVAIFPPVAGG
ncbi:MAG: ubiquitin-like small modifier protein 1 [Chloroflexota bacterium]